MTDTNIPVWQGLIEQQIRHWLAHEASGHDPWHAFRVRNLAISIAATVGADVDVVHAAALLHDIGHVSGRDDHANRGAGLAADLLSKSGFPKDKIPRVIACIQEHHWLPDRAGDPRNPPSEYQAFADADRLDALGAIGIARVFAFGGAHQRPIWNPERSATGGEYGISSVHHFYDKLLRLPHDMYTDAGRRLAIKRVAVMKQFLQTFYQEWRHEDVESSVKSNDPSLRPFSKPAVKVGDRIRRVFAAIFEPDPIR